MNDESREIQVISQLTLRSSKKKIMLPNNSAPSESTTFRLHFPLPLPFSKFQSYESHDP